MKKRISLLVLLSLLLSLTACVSQQYEYPVHFYYLRQENQIRYSEADGIITFETREAGRGDDLKYLLNLYFQGPSDEALVTPFPKGLSVVSAIQDQGTLELLLSDEFSDMTGIELTLACACIARTCLALNGIEAVNLTASGTGADTSHTIILTKDSIQFFDGTDLSVMPASHS